MAYPLAIAVPGDDGVHVGAPVQHEVAQQRQVPGTSREIQRGGVDALCADGELEIAVDVELPARGEVQRRETAVRLRVEPSAALGEAL